jgi:succinyldiaminopimelate transaminase
MPRFNPVLDQLPTYPFVELDRRKAALRAEGRPVYDFSMGDPVEPTPEFIRQALLGSVEASCPYPSVSGRPPVRTAISAYLQRRFGVRADPDTMILPTAGSKEAVFHTPLLVIDPHAPDRCVVFPDPGYPAYERGARFAGGVPHPVALRGDHRFRPWELPEEVLTQTRLLWINNPHNPSGAVSPLEDLARTAELCRAYDILLIADETYADIYEEGSEPPHSLLECGFDGLLVLHSLSKRSGMTGYRSGFLAGDPSLIRRLRDLRSNPGLAPQDFVNAAAAVAWNDDAHVAERRQLFNTKKQILTSFFESAGLEVVGGGATIYLWVRCPQGYDGTSWAHHLLSRGIVVTPGALLGITEAGAPYVRVALVPSPEECQAAVDAWRTLV